MTTKPVGGLYRKKPVVVEAYQFTQEMVDAHLFDGAALPCGVNLANASYHIASRKIRHASFRVTTIHGQQTPIDIGDWIILEPDRKHFYPCKPGIFAETYEEVTP